MANLNQDLTVLKPEYRASVVTLAWNLLGNYEQTVGGIYSNTIKTSQRDGYVYEVSFTVGEGRELGLLFAKVVHTPSDYSSSYELNYCFGEFRTNVGAMKFAEFALKNFIETETWDVVGSFHPVDYIDGVPHYLDGTEVVSDLA
jgi:hypothetical protein